MNMLIEFSVQGFWSRSGFGWLANSTKVLKNITYVQYVPSETVDSPSNTAVACVYTISYTRIYNTTINTAVHTQSGKSRPWKTLKTNWRFFFRSTVSLRFVRSYTVWAYGPANKEHLVLEISARPEKIILTHPWTTLRIAYSIGFSAALSSVS